MIRVRIGLAADMIGEIPGNHAPGDRVRPEPLDVPSTTGTAVVDEGRIHAL
ncbi:hypothetical protein GF325_01240 [Candidatus Bathyarchaeota archaeon]|nr:hypothetical protein [Candidatus Bathyarchaeota archaeon]